MSLLLSPLFVLLLLVLFAFRFAHAGGVDISAGDTASVAIRKFYFNITLAQLNPDCNASFTSPVINGQFPAPAIHVVKNDIIQLHIYNDPSHNFSSSIHIHGIRQYGSNRFDGVAGITQLAIAPGETFIQEFQVLNQTGTFYYHAHVGVQDDTLQGPLIVHEAQEHLENHSKDEIILHWAEWWHQSFHDRFDYYMSPQFIGDGGPDSVLLNGRSIYANTSINAAGAASSNCKGFTYFDVEPNKTYLVRAIGALTFRTLGIAVQGHNMTLVEIDAEPVQPHNVSYLEISPGQRMAFTIRTGNHAAGSVFPIVSNYRYRGQGLGYTPNGYGFLRYVDLATTNKQESVSFLTTPLVKDLPNIFPLVDTPGWITSELKSGASYPSDFILSESATRTIKLALKEIHMPDNTTRFIANGRAYVTEPWGNASMSLIDRVLAEPDLGAMDATDGFSFAHQTYPLELGEIVDLVFQNVQLPTGVCVLHPWHTHGHSHYLLAEGPGDYVHETDKDIRTYPNPIYRDVSIVYPRSVNGTENCGWTKVRLLTGKMVILEVAPKQLDGYYVPGGYQSLEQNGSSNEDASSELTGESDEAPEKSVEDESGGDAQEDGEFAEEDLGFESQQDGDDGYEEEEGEENGYGTSVDTSSKAQDNEDAYDNEMEDEGVKGG
ncbi:L-ascorbate oxidase [Mucor ambiguus]|uniref:L-ascorbate oxidase n=1 Tax=Mucor ambiguus TaxID=91626 RepID=A0A0C9N0S0_9FUNG|nr:L-ascorbate oxidase [Mucor ambiguus]